MATTIFKNETTGEVREVKIGASWTLLFFSGFLGIPLFMRKLHLWGAIILALYVLWVITGVAFLDDEEKAVLLYSVFYIGFLGIAIYLCVAGNKLTALNYIKLGFKISEENSDKKEIIKRAWGVPDSAFVK